MKEYHILDEQMLFILAQSDEGDSARIMDYIGVLGALHTRMLELACEHLGSPIP